MKIKGLKFAFLGDSITQGIGASSQDTIYHSVFKKRCGLKKVYNYGESGTRISKQTRTYNDRYAWDRNFISRVSDISDDVDVIVVFGGTNDYDHGDADLGVFSDRTDKTFYGALHILIEMLIKKFPDKTIVFISPLHRVGDDDPNNAKILKGYNLSKYRDAILEVCAFYSVPVLDLYANSGMNPCISEQNIRFFADGVHPNDNGHLRIAERLEGFFKSL